MIRRNIGEMDSKQMMAVVNYFSHNTTGKASDINISGAFASSLLARGLLVVVRTEEAYVPVGGLFRKVNINVYAIARGLTVDGVYDFYMRGVETIVNRETTRAEEMIACAQRRLAEAQALLVNVRR